MTSEDAVTLKAHIDGVYEAANRAEAKWGVDRLPLIVDSDLRARFERQRVRWQEALEEAYGAIVLTGPMLEAVRSRSAAMERAWAALDAEATRTGQAPVDPDVWEVALHDGRLAAIVRTTADASKIIREGRSTCVYTLNEIANVIDALPEALRQVKVSFPGSEVRTPKVRMARGFDDPVPF